MIEEVPGEASGLGVTSTGRSIETLTASIDANGRASIGWIDLSQGTPNLMVRRNAMPNVGLIYEAPTVHRFNPFSMPTTWWLVTLSLSKVY